MEIMDFAEQREKLMNEGKRRATEKCGASISAATRAMRIQAGLEKGTEKYLKYLMAENSQNVTKKQYIHPRNSTNSKEHKHKELSIWAHHRQNTESQR